MFTFKDLQDEVKRRATKDQGSTQFDAAVKTAINTSLFRISREAYWRNLRRKDSINTVTTYTTGSGAGSFTNNSADITVTGATFITDGIKIGRKIKVGDDGTYHTIKEITGETAITLDSVYSGTTTTTGTYSILPQSDYNLPIQCSHRMFLWHKAWGYPTKLEYILEQNFIDSSYYDTETGIPEVYKMWEPSMVIEDLLEPSVIRVVSTSALDTNCNITVFGTVSGYPDYEVIALNGTTAASGSKSFSSVERVVKDASTVGRVTVDANSGNATVAVLPVGDTTGGVLYKKISVYPLPNSVFPIYVEYYKDPYRLVNDGDVHELGQEFDEAIILLATSKIELESSKTEAASFYQLYKDEILSLKRTNSDKPDYIHRLKSRNNRSTMVGPHKYVSYNQMGPWYGPRV